MLFFHLRDIIFVSSDDIDRPIEKDILNETHGKGRIIEFSKHAVFDSKNVAILIRLMPEDEEKYGRYKDHLAILIDALEAKLLQFKEAQKKQLHYLVLEQTIASIAYSLEQVKQSYQTQRSLNTAILGELGQQLEKSFLTLGLDDVQEETLITLINDAENETDQVFEKGKDTEEIFIHIVDDLTRLLKKNRP